MGAVWVRLGAEMRGRWRVLLGLALLVALAGGVVLGAAQGARRTQTAYPRLLEVARAHEVLVTPAGTGLDGLYDRIERLPGVVGAGAVAGLNTEVLSPRPPEQFLFGGPFVAVDERAFRTVSRPKVLRPSEAAKSLTGRPTNGWWCFLVDKQARRSLRDVRRDYLESFADDVNEENGDDEDEEDQ